MQTSIQSTELRVSASVRNADCSRRDATRRIETLFARALEAFREGRAAEWTPPATGPTAERVENEQKRTFTFGPLSAADRSTLLRLAAPREQALALARAGRLDKADALMRVARFLLSLARLSRDAAAYAETMQQAAESYLSYQQGDYADAHSRMVASIAATDRLAASWGETDFIVCRRVDLAHNLMRVEMRKGASADAIQRGARLLEYIAGVPPGAGLIERAPTAAPPLDASVSRILVDLIMGTIAELLAPLPVPEARALIAMLAHLQDGALPSPHAARWLTTKRALLEGDIDRFLDAATPFLRAGRCRTPSLWYAVAHDLTLVYFHLHISVDATGVGEIEDELRTGSRVPACMRAPAREEIVLRDGNRVVA